MRRRERSSTPKAPSPGNAVTLFLEHENVTEVFIGLGEHLADQLLLLMTLFSWGVFAPTDISQHTRTNIDTIHRFLDVEIRTTQLSRKCWKIEAEK